MHRKSGIFVIKTHDSITRTKLGGEDLYYAFKVDGTFNDKIYVLNIKSNIYLCYDESEAKKIFEYVLDEPISIETKTKILKLFTEHTGYDLV